MSSDPTKDGTYTAAQWWRDNPDAASGYTAAGDTDIQGSLPGYDNATDVPGAQTQPPGATTPLPGGTLDQAGVPDYSYEPTSTDVTTAVDSAQLASAHQGLVALGAGAVPGLARAVGSMPDRTLQTSQPAQQEMDEPQAPPGQRGAPSSPAAVNVWSPVFVEGSLAAQVANADSSLINALQAAASTAGGRAAALAPTISLSGNRVTVGGDVPVGKRGSLASKFVGRSEYSGSPWFFPAVQAWVAAHPISPEQSMVPQGEPLEEPDQG
ncbi:MAG: hypothetical protein ACRDS0_35000 [Pseudonocardiaceae bacterium]